VSDADAGRKFCAKKAGSGGRADTHMKQERVSKFYRVCREVACRVLDSEAEERLGGEGKEWK
jgi:hypothetical protein